MGFKVLIADDEKGMRLIIKKILEKLKRYDEVFEAKTGEEAVEIFKEKRPDIVFLDVEMPGISGVECAKRMLDINPLAIIIFATAHSEYMSDAFSLYAFDYLVKPFKVERVYKTLDRVENLFQPRIINDSNNFLKNENTLGKLMIKNKEGISLIDTSEIVLVQREENSTVIYTLTDSFQTSASLTNIEEKLDKSKFFRSHKSYIINLSKITKIYPYGRWTYIVKLKGTEKDALLTHEKYEDIKKMFSL